jgi:hypothetical protein
VWVASTDWAVAGTGTDRDFSQLLAHEIITGQLTPTRRWQGALIGDYEMHLKVIRSTYELVPFKVSFNPVNREWRGDWFVIEENASTTDETPREIGRKPQDTIPLPSPTSNNGSDPGQNTITPAKDRILNELIPLTTGGSGISSGATVTSVEFSTAATGEDLIKDDVITLVNLNTGESQDFTVSANVSSTDTTVSVTSATASYDFPAGSFIIQKQLQQQQQLNTSLAKRLPLEDYQVNANYDNKLNIINMTEFAVQSRNDATSPTAVSTITSNMASLVCIYQKSGNDIAMALDDVTGAYFYYFNGSSYTGIQITDGNINIEGVPNYADDTAADAALSSGDIYTVTGDRTLYKKP